MHIEKSSKFCTVAIIMAVELSLHPSNMSGGVGKAGAQR